MNNSAIIKKLIEDFNTKAKLFDFSIKGLLINNNKVITLGSDSKLIGRVFELLSTEILYEICSNNNLIMEESISQTVYPDFTIILPNKSKIGVDIKSTYRRYTNSGYSKYGFTLGSFASFLRNNTKNIAYPYDQYIGHLVIGFVYDRVDNAAAGVLKELNDEIITPFNNLEFFIQEKYKIAGDKPGSGNTENIGSLLSTDINDFIEGRGVFSELGEKIFEDYWRNFPKYREFEKKYTNLNEYFVFRENNNR